MLISRHSGGARAAASAALTTIALLVLVEMAVAAPRESAAGAAPAAALWAWGHNDSGQLGDGTTTDSSVPVQVIGLTGVTFAKSGLYHTVAAREDGTVWGWGNNEYGQLGGATTATCGDEAEPCSPTPILIDGVSSAIAVSAGYGHSLALTSDGTVWAWGRNAWGQLGDGTTTGSTLPVPVTGVSGVTGLAHVYVGALYTVVLQGASGDPQQAQHTVARCQTPWLGSSGC